MRFELDKNSWGAPGEFDRVLDEVRDRRREFDQQRYVSKDVIERFRELGIYRAFVPREFGGDQRTPIDFLLAIEAISEVDGSAGWVASFGCCESYLAGLPLDVVQETWSNPDDIFAGAMFPLQPARIDGDDFVLSGRWKWASGCMSADRIGVGIMPDAEGALPRMAVMPASVAMFDTSSWEVHGMTGSGSFDVVLDDVRVPARNTFVRGGPLTPDGTFFRYPTMAIATQVLAVTALGVARTAIDLVVDSATERQSPTGAPNIGDREYVLIELGKAEAKLRAARLFFYASIDDAWTTLEAGHALDDEARSMMRLSSSHLVRECADVVRAAYTVSGMDAAYDHNDLSRCFRDVHLVTQHAFMGEITFRNAGAVMFGREPFPGYI